MAKAKMGVQMIEMYCGMVREKFAPILDALQNRKNSIEKYAKIEAKKRLGLYELYMEKFKHEHRIKEIEEELRDFEKSSYKTNYKSKIDLAAAEVIKSLETKDEKEIYDVYNKLIWDIKMIGVDEGMKNVLSNLDTIIEDLAVKVNALPPVVPREEPMMLEDD